MRRVAAAPVFVFSLVCCLTHPALAQEGSATLTGFIQDSSKAVIPGVKVTAIAANTNQRFEATTGKDGSYTIVSLPVGPYQMQIEKPGFKTILKDDLFLHTQDALEVNFQMAVGSTSETITVNGGAANDSPAVSLTVTRDFVEDTPLNGRSLQDLIALAPGVVSVPSGSGSGADAGLFSVNGQRGDANYYTVDGVAANTNAGGSASNVFSSTDARGLAGVMPAQTALGTTQSLVSLDDLQEFRIETSSYSAENGRQPGGQVQLTSRSGTNDLHGTLFDYLRNEAFDANAWVYNYYNLPRIPERQNDFGGTLGGPVTIPKIYNGRNKTFFFVNVEALRLLLPNFASIDVPTMQFRQLASSTIQPLLSALPLPNGANVGDQCAASLDPNYPNLPPNSPYGFSCSAVYNAGFDNPSHVTSPSVRLDEVVNSRLQLFARFTRTPSFSGCVNCNEVAGQGGTTNNNSHTWTIGSTWAISHSLTNETRLNWTYNAFINSSAPESIGGSVPYDSDLLLPTQYTSIGGSDTAGGSINYTYNNGNGNQDIQLPGYGSAIASVRQFNLVDSLSWTRGKHAIKFGGDLRRLQSLYSYQSYGVYEAFGTGSFESIEQGLTPFTAIFAGQPGSPTFTNFSLYAQDTWKLTSRVTLDLGVRWEFNPVPGASDGKYPLALTSSNLATAALATTGTPQYHTTYDNFAPRVGFAYRITPSQLHPLVVRGGYGIFYDTGQNMAATGYSGYPFSNQTILGPMPFPIPAADLAPPSLTGPLVPPYGPLQLNDPNLDLPYTHQWNLALSEGVSAHNTLTLSYVGSAGRRLLYTEFYYGSSASSVVSPNFTELQVTSNSASSNYNALQVQDQGYLAPGWRAIASYTWAHALDNASSDFNYSLPPTRGNADTDVRQLFNLASNYQVSGVRGGRVIRALASGWLLDETFTAQTGSPLSIYQSAYTVNYPAEYEGRVYPNLVPGVPIVLRGKAANAPFGWALNPAAFQPVQLNSDGSPVTQGDLSRNYVHGPGFWNFNSSFQRQFALTERLRFLFRTDAFNTFNHPNAGYIGTCLCNGPSFGKSFGYAATINSTSELYSTGSARSLQLSAKLQF